MALITGYVLCIALTLSFISAKDKVMTFNEQMRYLISNMMPNLNSSCVGEGCPELQSRSMCPRVDDAATEVKIINTANRCMTKSMCGFVMDPDVIPEVTFTTEGKQGFDNASVCSLLKGGTFANASRAQITGASETPQQININLFMPDLTVYGPMSCDSGHLNMSYYHFMTFNYTVVYNGTNVSVVNPLFKMIYIAYHTISPHGNITQSFTQFDPQVVASTGAMMGAVYSSFLADFYQSVFEVASQNCLL